MNHLKKKLKKFYNLLNVVEWLLWEGCTNHTKLFVAVKMLSIKIECNTLCKYFNLIGCLKETNQQKNLVPQDFYEINFFLSKLSLRSRELGYCVKDYLMYYKDTIMDVECKFCGAHIFNPYSRK